MRLPVWKQSWPMLSQVGPMCTGSAWVHVEPTLGPCWPMLGLCWPMLSPLGSYVGAKFGPSMGKRSEDAIFSAPDPLLEPKTR